VHVLVCKWFRRQKYSWPEQRQKFRSLVSRRLREWERERRLQMFRRVTPHLMGGAISMGVRWVREDESRDPKYRRPEPAGFAIDHAEGERWRRFNL
jgi:hypothetical protein